MKNILIITIVAIIFTNCCKDDISNCECREWEECIEDVCVLKDNTYHLGNYVFEGENLFHGFLNKGTCTDTVVFHYAGDYQDFFIWVNREDDNFPAVANIIVSQDSNKVRISRLPTPYLLCTDKWASTYDCEIFDDSVNVTLYLKDDKDGIFVDTAYTTLFKN